MAKNGRPVKEIDWAEFDKLCGLQCTQKEIAEWFNVSVDTIERACKREQGAGFADYYEQKASKGRISLRRKQYELAMSGDRVMLIWLGKQYLKQSEKVEQTSSIKFDNMTPEEMDARIEELLKERELKLKAK